MNVIRLPNSDTGDSAPRIKSAATRAIAGFDVLRAGAALAVVALHAGVPYARHPMPGLIWPVSDSRSGVVDAIFWSIEVFIMPLFLVMAGFLLWRSSSRLSPIGLVKSRASRLLVPLAFGMIVILPVDLYLWTAGLVAEGIVPVAKLKSLKFESSISDQIWGLSHLWFLLYVFLYVVVAASVIRLTSQGLLAPWARLASRPKTLAAMLATIAFVTLAAAPEVVWGFQHAFLPVPSKWIYSGAFFAAGCGLAKHDAELKWTASTSSQFLGLGSILLATSVMLGIWSLDQSEQGRAINALATMLLALLTMTAAITITLGLIGAGVRYVSTLPRWVAYIASASFWIYLIHHPLIGLIHCDLKWLWPSGSPVVKLWVSFASATGLSLLMYESFVRQTRLGAALGLAQAPLMPAKTPPSQIQEPSNATVRLPVQDTDHQRAA